PLAQRLPHGSEAGNAHEFRTRIGEERKRGHRLIFAFYSRMILSRVVQCKPRIAALWIEGQSGEIKIHLVKLRLGGVASGYLAQPVTLPSGSANHWGSSPPPSARHSAQQIWIVTDLLD